MLSSGFTWIVVHWNLADFDHQSPRSGGNRCWSISASPSASPSSSFGRSFTEMNDTQNTVLTEPDDVPAVATVRPTPVALTPEELLQVWLHSTTFTNNLTSPPES
jgi:hypothetical protein